jgi:signal transduction histidine kinase
VQEVQQLSITFESMRRALASRIEELRTTNAALVDRSARLTALQSDLMQRDRLGAAGRLVAQLAHEIRNPIASLRNCLELIRRRVNSDAEAREFADLAIDELLRMHELTEQILDLNRPRDAGAQRCSPVHVAHETRRLALVGSGDGDLRIEISGDAMLTAAIGADALKQVLLNLVQNAREAHDGWTGRADGPPRVEIDVRSDGDRVCIAVSDNGPGIPEGIRSRIFDPFFTTQHAVHGVGLGLFVAEGLIRTAGGRITAGNATRNGDGGARFDIELPAAAVESSASEPGHSRSTA